jgi:spermidine synthase
MTAARRAFLYLCFFLTGIFGLVYEVVWSRYLALMIGNAAHAYITVLATFMGGLALGAMLFGRLSDRVRNGFRVYGLIELGVGGYALLFPLLFTGLERVFLPLGRLFTPGTGGMVWFKIGFAMLCILLPTILMGGTLPVLTRYLTAAPTALRRNVSSLYALNAAGAVVGCLLAGFWIVPRFGLPGGMWAVGALNALTGLTVWLVGARYPQRHDDEPAPSGDMTAAAFIQDAQQYSRAVQAMAVIAAGVSGFAGMALEVAWIRYFTLALGSSTYAFTIMLAAFITGISLGAFWLAGRRASRLPLLSVLAATSFGTALFLAVSLWFYDRLPFFLWQVLQLFQPQPAAYPAYQAVVYAICFGCMLFPTLSGGVVFPAVVRLASRRERLGGGVGVVYGVNTIGALTGSALPGLLLFSWLGLENIFRLLIVLYALMAIGFSWFVAGRDRRVWFAAAVLLAAVHLFAYRPMNPRLINQGLYNLRHARLDDAKFQALVESEELLFLGEGPHAMVTVRGQAGRNKFLTVNGKPDASTALDGDMYTQMLIGHLPMLFHPAPREVFMVGLGSGVTAGAVLTHGVRLDLAEISREVVDAGAYFAVESHAPLQNPRLRLFIEDAKTALNLLDKRYDVIISEPTNPWIAGVAGLFSREFFTLVKSRLNPGGVFAQWMHSYNSTDETMAMVVATLLDSFPHVYVFQTLTNDYVFVALQQPWRLDAGAWQRRLAEPEVQADLARIHADNLAVLLSMQTKSPPRLRVDTPAGPINSDFLPRLEFQAPIGLFLGKSSDWLVDRDDRRFNEPALLLSEYRRAHPLTPDDVRHLAAFYANFEPNQDKWPAVLQLCRQVLGPEAPETRRLFDLTRNVSASAIAAYWGAYRLDRETSPVDVRERLELGIKYFAERYSALAPPPAADLIAMVDWLEARGEDPYAYRLTLLKVLCAKGETADCVAQAAALEQRAQREAAPPRWLPDVHAARYDCATRTWDLPEAARQLERLREFGLGGTTRFVDMESRLRRLHETAAAR